jgi:hypothetical protein
MLYPTDDWSVTEQLLQRAESAGSPAIVLAADAAIGKDDRPNRSPRSCRLLNDWDLWRSRTDRGRPFNTPGQRRIAPWGNIPEAVIRR